LFLTIPDASATSGAKKSQLPFLVPAIIAAVYFLVHMATATRYGYFRDALYYLACSEHLAWGYVDQPPPIVFIAWLARHTLGVSLPALLFWPALAGAARIILTAGFARELGAKKCGAALAAALAATPTVWYVIDHQFAMNALKPLFWTGCAFAVARLIRMNNPEWWLAFCTIAGSGLKNKYSIAAFAFFLLLGLLLTPQRRLLFSPWILAGGFAALLLFLPNLLWNIQHHWPFLELMRNIRASGRDVVLSPSAFLAEQILIMSPVTLPFWLGGLWFYFSDAGKKFRVFGWTFIFTIRFFLLAHGKNYYSAPVYPLVLAAGAVAAEKFLSKNVLKNCPVYGPHLKWRYLAGSLSGYCFCCRSCFLFYPSKRICAIRRICHSLFQNPSIIRTRQPCRSITPMSLAGKIWSPMLPPFITR
jgi:4-amino-4-deoxy-L-arabinose transferase-like glycosyltransferase